MKALPIRLCERYKRLLVIFLPGLVLLCFAGVAVPAGETLKGGGALTSVDGGTVMINGKGYTVSASAQISDWRGYPVSLRRFSLPARVYFEFEQTQDGPVIRLIKEIPQ